MESSYFFGFFLTGFTAWLISTFTYNQKIKVMAANLNASTTELNSVKQLVVEKSNDYTTALTILNKEHAEELLKIRANNQAVLAEKDDTYRAEAKKLEAEAFSAGIRQKELHYEAVGAAIKVQMSPYLKRVKEAGLINDTHRCSIGYQYQLMVQGIPCFEPHVKIVEEVVEKEINEARFNLLVSKAVELTKFAINSNAAAAQSLQFAEKPIIESTEKGVF